MDNDPYQQEIVQWLTDHGHAPDQVEIIMKRLEQYDSRVVRDSLFDSIEAGGFDIGSIIKETLKESDAE